MNPLLRRTTEGNYLLFSLNQIQLTNNITHLAHLTVSHRSSTSSTISDSELTKTRMNIVTFTSLFFLFLYISFCFVLDILLRSLNLFSQISLFHFKAILWYITIMSIIRNNRVVVRVNRVNQVIVHKYHSHPVRKFYMVNFFSLANRSGLFVNYLVNLINVFLFFSTNKNFQLINF